VHVSIFILGPLLIMIDISLTAEGYISLPTKGHSLRWYEDMLQQRIFLDAAMNSILLANEPTATAFVLGTAVALAVTRYRFPGRGLILLLSGAPLFVPLVMTGLAVLIFFSALGIGGPALRLYVAHVALTIPYIVRMVSVSLAGFDWNQELAARNLGASPLRAFLEVTLPLSLPGIMAGSLLVFALTISSYVTPYLLGGTDVLTLPMMIYSQIAASFNPAFAGTLGMLLLAVALVLVVAYNNVLGRLGRRGDLA
jgi:ABC-type spermidine/putrescine transport system permease subunit II